MKITHITSQLVPIPLVRTFTTSLRSISQVDSILVIIHTDENHTGYGSAAPVPVITGETVESILGAVNYIGQQLSGMVLENAELIFQKLNSCMIGSMSAKAAIDMAIYDLLAKSMGVPLYQLLGGKNQELNTDITISLGSPDQMLAECRERIEEGYRVIKIKVGGNPDTDIERLLRIHDAYGEKVLIRIDANQGWKAKEAVYVCRALEGAKVPIDLVEQPVAASDVDGMRFVRENTLFPVFADESIFSPQDALKFIEQRAIDGINIKLMKCGGIYNALKIIAIAESADLPCMIGSMMEAPLSVLAAAQLASCKTVISRFDLDAPLFCQTNPLANGLSYMGSTVCLSDLSGLGTGSITL
ncbi:dipeptide epimerase [Desulforhopalus sp. IMCC35007]|uniref:dipeptide epimerase n=1 Tax=Desulforhopalus sp. IMCC35007 TaxID=2569543 RepID=UPI0010ADFE5E|nr:dipeptide epimerase [Desulforhopalus sp. IMCC35007]TKB11618.1 dipeptide epimerase [Desulforhopalus sp. IMCC35007]